MENLTINEIDLTQLIDSAISTDNKAALNAYKNIVQCMIEQHEYDCEAHNDELCLMDEWELNHMRVIKQCLDKLIDKIDKAL